MARNPSSPIEERILPFLASHPTSRRYLVAVSGGCDSVVLLHLLLDLGYRRLVVCHLDHRLRGRESAADAAFVRRMAGRHGLACECGRRDVRALADQLGVSIEAAGRAARHEFLGGAAGRHRCPRVFLAHHADDQAETVLINLLRGSGPRGLAGMRGVSTLRVATGGPSGRTRGRSLTLLRPLLGVWRSELEEFAAARGLRYREDASNRDPAFLRNRVRHELLPMATRLFGRDVRRSLVRTAAIVAEEHAALDALADALWQSCQVGGTTPGTMKTPAIPAISVKALRGAVPALQRRVIVRWLKECAVPDIGFQLVEAIRLLAEPHGPLGVNLPGGRSARRRAGRLEIRS